jgi:hypothetical protein
MFAKLCRQIFLPLQKRFTIYCKWICIFNIHKQVSFHLQFSIHSNIGDVAKVLQGILLASRSTVFSPDGMIRLWAHEGQRVFSDRFLWTNTIDEQRFRDILAANMTESMQKDWFDSWPLTIAVVAHFPHHIN